MSWATVQGASACSSASPAPPAGAAGRYPATAPAKRQQENTSAGCCGSELRCRPSYFIHTAAAEACERAQSAHAWPDATAGWRADGNAVSAATSDGLVATPAALPAVLPSNRNPALTNWQNSTRASRRPHQRLHHSAPMPPQRCGRLAELLTLCAGSCWPRRTWH